MEQNLRFGLVLSLLAILKTAQPNLLLAILEGIFLCFYGQIKLNKAKLRQPTGKSQENFNFGRNLLKF